MAFIKMDDLSTMEIDTPYSSPLSSLTSSPSPFRRQGKSDQPLPHSPSNSLALRPATSATNLQACIPPNIAMPSSNITSDNIQPAFQNLPSRTKPHILHNGNKTPTPKQKEKMIIEKGKNDIFITLHINNLKFTYSNAGFRHLGHPWVLTPLSSPAHLLNSPSFWRAQMAFHALPTAGLDLRGMQAVLKAANRDAMDDHVRKEKARMCEQYQAWQERFLAEDRRRRWPVEYVRFARHEPANFLRGMFFRGGGRWGRDGVYLDCDVDSERDGDRDSDSTGEVEEIDVWQPILLLWFSHLEHTSKDEMDEFKINCVKLGLHFRVSKACHVIVGREEGEVRRLVWEVDRAPKERFGKRDPWYDSEEWVYDGDDGDRVKEEEEDDDEDAEFEWDDEFLSDAEEEEEGGAEWDITGTWTLEFPNNDKLVIPSISPGYTLEIFSTCTKSSRETYGRFNFSRFHGFFRFLRPEEDLDEIGETDDEETEGQNGGTARKFPPRDNFDLDINDIPSQSNPTRSYLWRGKRTKEPRKGETVYEDLFTKPGTGKMKFSNKGKMRGIWNIEDEKGRVETLEFEGVRERTGRQVERDGRGKGGVSIHYEWESKRQGAYYVGKYSEWMLKGKGL